MTKRERIDMCLNCTRATCDGECDRFGRKKPPVMMLYAFGELKTVRQWSEKTGISTKAMYNRLYKLGMDMEAAINMGPVRVRKKQCAFGEKKSMAEWSRITGIHVNTLTARMQKCHMTLEEAIKAGPERMRRRAER